MTETTAVRPGRGMSRRRFVTIVLLGMLLGAIVGTTLGLARGDRYTATSVILVAPLIGNPYSLEGRNDDLLNLETEAQLVGSDRVARSVAQEEDVDPLAVLGGLDVEVPPNTQILRVSYTDDQETVAVRRAQLFATEYLAARVARGEIASQNEQDRVRAQVRQINGRMDRLENRIINTDDPGRRRLLQDQLTVLTTQATSLRSEFAQSRASSKEPGQIVNPAVEASAFPVPMPVLGAFVGGFIGAFLAALGAAAVANRQHRDD